MEKTELMIGDWVHFYLGSYASPQGEMDYQLKDYTDLDRASNFRPIPLTPEILEKNGFVVKSSSRHWIRECVSVYPATNKDNFTDIDHPVLQIHRYGKSQEMNIRCDYVHTLQHALRLCGLNELADNFKI